MSHDFYLNFTSNKSVKYPKLSTAWKIQKTEPSILLLIRFRSDIISRSLKNGFSLEISFLGFLFRASGYWDPR